MIRGIVRPVTEKGSNKELDLKARFLQHISNIPDGKNLNKCIQCGTCTGSCPASYVMDVTPREVIALFRAGDIRSILSSRTIWICASCYACTVRCPQNIPVTDIIYMLKRMAIEQEIFPKRFPVYALSRSFVSIANRYGRSFEPGLLILYYLKTNPMNLVKMIPLFLKLVARGRIMVIPKKIKAARALSEILSEAQIMEMIVPAPEEYVY